MHWIDTVASYLPSLIVNHLINRTTNEELPSRQQYDTVCLFADVSGFTALSEAMMTSQEGVEGLARHLNSYFGQMVRIIASEGGDVFKFAGDALIVLWPPPMRDSADAVAVSTKRGREGDAGEQQEGTTPMERRVRRAAQCAFAIQDALHNCELAQEVRLSVKIGIGMGKVSVLHLGGVYKRMEYIAVGEPLLEAFMAEHHATPGDVIISAQAHKLVKGHFTTTQTFEDHYCRVVKEQMYTPMRKQNKVNMLQQSLDDPLLALKVKGYIPGAVIRNLRPDSPEDEHWSNEIRRVTVLFVNLGLKEQTLLAAAVYDEAMEEMHRVMVAVQESVYEYEGSINKFLMDDKGSTLVAVYGLPPVGHADDPTRGVLAALRLCERLFDLAKVGSVGVTTGEAFCGVVGSKTRKEYTVLGDSVNLAARLMQRATSEDGGVLCELATKRACGGLLQFKARGDFRVKGKIAAAKVFHPYPEDYPKPQPPQYLGANMYGLIHNQQRQNYAMHKLLTGLQPYFARPSFREPKENMSGQTSAVSSPTGERGRPIHGRDSMTESGGDADDDGMEHDTLLGMGDHPEMDASDNHPMEGFDEDNHLELLEPNYSDALRMPFQTGAIPIGMSSSEGESHHTLGSCDTRDDNDAAAITTAAASGRGASVGAPYNDPQRRPSGSAPSRPNAVGKLNNPRDFSRSPDPSEEGKMTSASPEGDRRLAAKQRGASYGSANGADSGGEGVTPMMACLDQQARQRSDRLKTIFADRGSASASAAGSGSAPASVSGSFSAAGRRSHANSLSINGEDNASRDGESPTPARTMSGRRQGDSLMKKIFNRGDQAGKEDSGLATTNGAAESGGDAGEAASALSRSGSGAALGGVRGAGMGPGAWAVDPNASPPRDPSATTVPAAVPPAVGGRLRGSGRSHAKTTALRSSMYSGRDDVSMGGEGKADLDARGRASEEPAKERLVFTDLENAMANRDNFKRESSGGVVLDEDEVYMPTAVGQRRRSSRHRLSIAQNGMVLLPASTGIPRIDLGSSGSCSLPRYSRYSSQQFGTGSSSSGFQAGFNAAFQASTGRRLNQSSQPSFSQGSGQSLSILPPGPPAMPGATGSSERLTASSGQAGMMLRNVPGKKLDDSASSASSNGGAGVIRTIQAPMREVYEDWNLYVVVPRLWKWSSLPDRCQRLPTVFGSEVGTFKGLLDRCWSYACSDPEVMRWSTPIPPREELVLNIIGTRVILPTDPDYDIDRLHDFVQEACGTRGSRGFMGTRNNFPPEAWGFGGGNSIGFGGGSVELFLVPKKEILNFPSRWLNSRFSLLQHKIALVQDQVGSVVLLEGLPGAGKTELLSVFAARTLMRTALTHFTAASPYNASMSFGSWSMVLQQELDRLYKHEVQAGREDPGVQNQDSGGEENSGGGVARLLVSGGAEATLSSIMGHRHQLAGRDRMLLRELQGTDMEPYAFLVNDVLGTAIPRRVTVPSWDADSRSSGTSGDGDGLNDSESSDPDESSSVGHNERMKLRILLHLVKNMTKGRPRVVIIDDAQFMDKDSWTLALAIATGGVLGRPLPLMLILSLRPLVHYRGLFSSIPPDYKALTELPHVHFLKIEGVPPEEVEDLVSEKLGTNVVDIGDSLFGLVEDLCTGNPLMISELVSHLKMADPRQLRYSAIRSEEGEGDQGASQNNIDVPVHVELMDTSRLCSLLPEKLNALLTSQTDRLNSCQLMALKVASLIGKEFSTWFLYRVYPINGHKDRLLRELAALEEQGFLVEVQGERAQAVIEMEGCVRSTMALGIGQANSTKDQDAVDHSRSAKNIVYRFTHGFMTEMLQLKMLYSQKDFLRARIQKLKDSLETQRRHEDLKNQTIDTAQKLKSGILQVMKHKVTKVQAAANARESTRRRKDSITSRAIARVKQPVQQKWGEAVDWKRRKCVLMGESISLFKDYRDKEPSEVVYLQDATAEPELGENFKESGFRVETSLWKKGDEIVDALERGQRRTFTFLADNKEEKELWLYQIRHCIEVIEVHARKSGAVIDRLSRMTSVRFGASDTRPNEPMEEMDSTLVVKVEKADDLILEEICGTTYPYCVVDLDDQGRRTNSVQSASVTPVWEQELTFPVSIQQWILSNLRIQVWNHDLFLTDDFLGQVAIPLKEVPVQEWNEHGDSPRTELKWYKLESRCRSRHTCGKLLVGVQLLMSKQTTARAAGVGGVDKLKAFAERRMHVSALAARVGQLQQRKQTLAGVLHHDKLHPGMLLPAVNSGFSRGVSGGAGINCNADTSIRASIRTMQIELEGSRGDSSCSRGSDGAGRSPDTVRLESGSSYGGAATQTDIGEEDGFYGGGGDVLAGAGGATGALRPSQRYRRRSTGHKPRRATSDGSGHGAITAPEVHHTDPLTRQLQLCLLAVETKAEVSKPEEGAGVGGSVNRDWIREKLREMMAMVGRRDVELDQLDTHTYYCKDRKENTYGPFPAKQLVEAHNAGYINDRKVLVKEASMRGEFRPIGAKWLMHGPPRDEEFKMRTMWPQVDAHHPLASKILSLSLGENGPNDASRDFRQWGFDIFVLETHELGMLAATILVDTGLPSVFGISMKTFAHFMSAVGFFMGRNPRVSYHNLYHAVDVMHATYMSLDCMGASGLLEAMEELALIMSALCHDLDHPGLTNSYQTVTESPLANLYNDQAPLEHHHLAITFQILRREGCDILGHLDKPTKDRIRRVMIQSILATEMSEHAMHIKKIDNLTEDFPAISDRIQAWASGEIGRGSDRTGSYPASPPTHTETSSASGASGAATSATAASAPLPAGGAAATPGRPRRQGLQGQARGVANRSRVVQVPGADAAALGFEDHDRLTVASALLHAADVSSPGRPWGTCKVWVERLLEEFKFQAGEERQRGLRVTVLEGSPSSSQPGFIDAFLIPFFTALLPVAPGLRDEFMPNLHSNRAQWEAIAIQEELAEERLASGWRPRDRSGTESSSMNVGGDTLDPDTVMGRAFSATFGGDRRYSGGTIGIASMLGSLGTVSSGREEGQMAKRSSSVLSMPPISPRGSWSYGGGIVGSGPMGAS